MRRIVAHKSFAQTVKSIGFLLVSTNLNYSESFHILKSSVTHERSTSWLLKMRQDHKRQLKQDVVSFDPISIKRDLELLGAQNVSIDVIREDPLVYRVHNLLSPGDCEDYRTYVADRNMTRSNPPQVSLEVSKLWPLPFLALGAGLPPYFRLVAGKGDTIELGAILSAVTPNIIVALLGMIFLAWFIVLPSLRRMSETSSRTSLAVALNQEGRDEELCRALVERACSAASGHPWYAWEAPVVTRYDPGAIFARHGDASPTLGSEWEDSGGQRVVTCICYLNTLLDGGETYFDQLDIAVAPVAGSALFFLPADKETWRADDRTTHESLPAYEEKWIVQLFGRIQRVPPPLGLPDSFGTVLSVSSTI